MGEPPEEASAVDVARPMPPPLRLAALRRVAAESGRSFLHLLAEWAALRLRQGLSLDEYVGLRLFDNRIYEGADKRAFVGTKASRKILLRANYRIDLYGLIDHKIACDFLLAAHGIPIMPTVALYRESTGLAAPFLLRSGEELRRFLSSVDRYPLFAKPLSGTQSLGAISVDRYDAAREVLVAFDGSEVSVDVFIGQVRAHYATGYLLQRRVSPHAAVRALCGDRLATVRLLTAMTGQGPQILRACWKIPSGRNAADNFWRSGNLLAQLELETGRVLRAVRSTPRGFEETPRHPDTGAVLAGAMIPNWRELLELAREGARCWRICRCWAGTSPRSIRARWWSRSTICRISSSTRSPIAAAFSTRHSWASCATGMPTRCGGGAGADRHTFSQNEQHIGRSLQPEAAIDKLLPLIGSEARSAA